MGGGATRWIAAAAGARAGDLTGGPCGRSPPLGRVQARHGSPEPAPVRGHSAGPAAGPNRRRGDARTAQAVPRQQPTAAARQLLRGRYRGRPVSSAGPVAILPRDQGRPLSSVHHRRPRLCAASKRACERLPRQHETAAACGVSATNRQGGRVGVVYIDHAPPVWGCPGPAARPTSACSAEQRAAGHRGHHSHRFSGPIGETAATGGAMSGTGPGRRAGETVPRSPEPVETNYAISGRVYGPQRRQSASKRAWWSAGTPHPSLILWVSRRATALDLDQSIQSPISPPNAAFLVLLSTTESVVPGRPPMANWDSLGGVGAGRSARCGCWGGHGGRLPGA